MGLAGAGGGAAQGYGLLQQLLLRKQAQAAQEEQAQALLAQRQQEMGQRAQEQAAEQEWRNKQLESVDTARRAASNTQQLGLMNEQAGMMARADAIKQLPEHLQQLANVRGVPELKNVNVDDLMRPEDRAAKEAEAQRRELEQAVELAGRKTAAEEAAKARYREPKDAAAGGAVNEKDARIQEYAREKTDEALATVDEILKMGGDGSIPGTGYENYLGVLPGSPARDLNNVLNQLTAQIAFKELAAMRAASPTGGALGQVSERELSLLSSVLGGLDPKAANFKQQLEKIRGSLERMKGALPAGANRGVTAAPMAAPAGAVTVTVGGKTYAFPDQASADRFRKMAGGQ